MQLRRTIEFILKTKGKCCSLARTGHFTTIANVCGRECVCACQQIVVRVWCVFSVPYYKSHNNNFLKSLHIFGCLNLRLQQPKTMMMMTMGIRMLLFQLWLAFYLMLPSVEVPFCDIYMCIYIFSRSRTQPTHRTGWDAEMRHTWTDFSVGLFIYPHLMLNSVTAALLSHCCSCQSDIVVG